MTHFKTTLEYSYEPTGFFESKLLIEMSFGTLQVADGRAVVTLPRGRQLDHAATAELTDGVRGVFLARQLLMHERFELAGPSIVKQFEDGRRDITLQVDSFHVAVRVSSPDLVVTDPSGMVVRDTRTERIAEHEEFVGAIAPKVAMSPVLQRLLSSYEAAVNDPTNELLHLYEVRDAIVVYYRGELAARKALTISSDEWSRFGRLANYEPIKEGRHRGRQETELRAATDEERNAARRFARLLIVRFAATVA